MKKNDKLQELQQQQHEFEQQQLQNKAMLYQRTASQIADSVYDLASDSEDGMANFAKSMLHMALDVLKRQTQIAVAGVTIESLAQPDSVATFGASGLARAAILVGLIEAAFAAVEGLAGRGIDSMFDNKSRRNLWDGGFTGLGGKYEEANVKVHKGEYVIPQEGVYNPQLHPIIAAMEEARQQGRLQTLNLDAILSQQSQRQLYSGGPTSNMPASQNIKVDASTGFDAETIEAIKMFTQTMKQISQKGIKGNWVYQDLKDIEDEYNDIQNSVNIS